MADLNTESPVKYQGWLTTRFYISLFFIETGGAGGYAQRELHTHSSMMQVLLRFLLVFVTRSVSPDAASASTSFPVFFSI